MKKILIFIFSIITLNVFAQDTKLDYSAAQMDSILNGTKKVDIPTHSNSNGDKQILDIDVKSLVDKINSSNANTDTKHIFSIVGNSIRIDSFDNVTGAIVGSPQFIDDAINKPQNVYKKCDGTDLLNGDKVYEVKDLNRQSGMGITKQNGTDCLGNNDEFYNSIKKSYSANSSFANSSLGEYSRVLNGLYCTAGGGADLIGSASNVNTGSTGDRNGVFSGDDINVTNGHSDFVYASQSGSITNSIMSVLGGSQGSSISSLSYNNGIYGSRNCHINSIPSANSELSGIYSSINCNLNSSYKNVIIASSDTHMDCWGGNMVAIGSSGCTVTNCYGFLDMRGYNNNVNTDGAYVSVSGSNNTIGYKSTLSTILNGYQLSNQGAHNTFINGQNSEIKSDAASFHGFNTHINGESNLFDSVSYNGILGNGLMGYTSYQFSLGAYNVNKKAITQQKVLWNYNDDLVTIGNGSDVNNRSNALTLKKSGKFQINSIVGAKSIQDVEPEVTAEFIGKDAIAIPAGTTADRPSAPSNNSTVKSYIRYNTSTGKFEGYDLNTSTWVDLN